MHNKQVVQDYLTAMFGGRGEFDRARSLLADDLRYEGPMLEAPNADAFIGQMKEIGAAVGPMKATIRSIIGEGDLVAALYEFSEPHRVLFAEWFSVADGRITSITIVHDTRPYGAASETRSP